MKRIEDTFVRGGCCFARLLAYHGSMYQSTGKRTSHRCVFPGGTVRRTLGRGLRGSGGNRGHGTRRWAGHVRRHGGGDELGDPRAGGRFQGVCLLSEHGRCQPGLSGGSRRGHRHIRDATRSTGRPPVHEDRWNLCRPPASDRVCRHGDLACAPPGHTSAALSSYPCEQGFSAEPSIRFTSPISTPPRPQYTRQNWIASSSSRPAIRGRSGIDE